MASPNLEQICRDLIQLSRFDRYNSLIALFPSVFSTLLAGALKLRQDPNDTTVWFVLRQTTLCALHCYLFSGAGMVWNDWIDRDIDARVARTRNRPLAARRVQVCHAMIWMALQYFLSAQVLLYAIKNKSVWVFSMLLETAGTILYPFGKRPAARKWYIYPQYILGALGLPLVVSGWESIYYRGVLDTVSRSLPLSLFVFFWILYYNTAYSYQDVCDDRKMNVHSIYTMAGQHIHMFLVFLGTIVLLNIAWVLTRLGSTWLWFSWMGVWVFAYLAQFTIFDATKPHTGGVVHKQNVLLGIWGIVACMVEVLLAQRI